ncbi:hypothetical protein ENUP19_0080G0062 [Entamoeba nuttalli]|uniref:Uncharacterized protein n=2 Tax=Entamoeba nuttalli TaxID=412467 RepID=K2GQR4_ENTNP|nr:hypothetical protein ENU1_202390 [Entamoeba nuttalli P19]EKE37298.1 hypothetical protein ENU1_202390 [Entamoeba nuttalli P19]|eukprot:XP_008860366.1 hypothetical protein ENU1_202390 [Entamoeba nuttalli P19]
MSSTVERNEKGEIVRTTSAIVSIKHSPSDLYSCEDYGYESNVEEVEEDVEEESFTDEISDTEEEGDDEDELIERNKELIQMVEELMKRTREVQSMYYKEKERKEVVLKELEKEKRAGEILRTKIEEFDDLIQTTKAVASENEKLLVELDLEKKQHSETLKRLAELEDGSERKNVDGRFFCVMELTVMNGEVVQSKLLRDLDQEYARLRSENQHMLEEVCKIKLSLEGKKNIEKEFEEAKKRIEELEQVVKEINLRNQTININEDNKVTRKSILKLKKMMSSVMENTAPLINIDTVQLTKQSERHLRNTINGRHSIMCQPMSQMIKTGLDHSSMRKSEASRFLGTQKKNQEKSTTLVEQEGIENFTLNQNKLPLIKLDIDDDDKKKEEQNNINECNQKSQLNEEFNQVTTNQLQNEPEKEIRKERIFGCGKITTIVVFLIMACFISLILSVD